MFNILVIVGVAMAAYQRVLLRPRALTLNMDAWIILFLIFWLMVTDVMVNSFEIYLFEQRERDSARSSPTASAQIWDGIGHVPEHRRGAPRLLLVPAPARLPHLPLLLAVLEALARAHDRAAGLHAPPRADGRPRADRRHGEANGSGRGVRRRQADRLQLEATPRLVLVHGVRPLHGGLPCEPDRQGALAEAGHRRHPPPDGREHARLRLATQGQTARSNGHTATRAANGESTGPHRARRLRADLGLRDLRRLHGGVPRLHRAHRHDHGHASLHGDGAGATCRRRRRRRSRSSSSAATPGAARSSRARPGSRR